MALMTGTRLAAAGVLAVSLLAACGSSSSTLGPTGIAATPTAAGPVAKTVSGTITYAGSVSPAHQIIIVLNRQGESAPAYSTVVAKPGPYSIGGVADGTYSITAFMDLGDDMGPPGTAEPIGTYDVLTMQNGQGLTGIDITLKDK